MSGHYLALPIAAALLAILATPPALGLTFTVNSTLDQPDDLTIPDTCHTAANTCTLRAAVMQANRAGGVTVTIDVPAGIYALTLPPGADDASGGLKLKHVSSGKPAIIIQRKGAGTTIIDANQKYRLLTVDAGVSVALSGLTLRGGRVPLDTSVASHGGGVYSEGTLSLDECTVSGNQGGLGGGIFNGGNLTVSQSTIGPNSASGLGGGIFNTSTLTVRGSTFYGNSAVDGGAIYNAKDMVLIDSTLSQNHVTGSGGGIYNNVTANVYNASIVFNWADNDRQGAGSAGGVYNRAGGVFNLRNTLIAGNNVGDAPVYDDCTGTFVAYGRNAFGEHSACTIQKAAGGDYIAINSLSLIGQLQDNGGPTFTHGLLAGSNAIDAGDPVQGCVDNNSFPLFTDQRGAARVAGARCDIGAYEYNSVPPPPATVDAIEYHHAVFDHYFVTFIPDEITKLDNGTFAGWLRTGESIKVVAAPAYGVFDVCRFFSTAFAPKSSHFYTPDSNECAKVKANPNWQFEAVVFYMPKADASGNCPAFTVPVYRLYNNGQGAAPNHRYTTSLPIRAQMIAQGWIPEGYGSVGVIMCTPVDVPLVRN
jgi:Repeat of unknown function (DUF5648)